MDEDSLTLMSITSCHNILTLRIFRSSNPAFVHQGGCVVGIAIATTRQVLHGTITRGTGATLQCLYTWLQFIQVWAHE